MDELKAKVEELEAAKDDEERIQVLQKIGAKLINEYEIKIGRLTIKPMLVEAYYFSKNFQDDAAHAANSSKANTYELARQRQKNHFGELYIHYGTKDGLDIVLSDGENYFLSFLIKNSLVEEDGKWEWKTQCTVSEKLCEKCDAYDTCEKGKRCKYYGVKVLHRLPDTSKQEIVFIPRRGIPADKKYVRTPLAALPIAEIRKYKFTPGVSCTDIIRCYITQQLKNGVDDQKLEKLQALAKGLIAWKTFKEN